MKKYFWYIAAAVLAAGIAAYLLREPIGEYIIVPIAIAVERVRFYVNSVPQAVFWLPMTILSAVFAVSTSVRLVRRKKRPTSMTTIAEGTIAARTEMLKRVSKGRYYRMRLKRDLDDVTALLNGRPSASAADDVEEFDEKGFREYLDGTLRSIEEEIR